MAKDSSCGMGWLGLIYRSGMGTAGNPDALVLRPIQKPS